NKSKNYTFPTKTTDIEKYTELENLLKKSKYWNGVSSVNAQKVGQLLEDDGIDSRLKQKIIALAPLEESTNLSIRKK
ncbi:MAG: hypothetical protein U9P90_01040, partial [Patescibacteria group bacterium]|nr:hypothetical protein [Patescibacteria group bacterium]